MPDDNIGTAPIGLITLDLGFAPLPGMLAHPGAIGRHVLREQLSGGGLTARIVAADPALRDAVLDAARRLVERGARRVATSCGYFAAYQRDLEWATGVPVFSSPLTQLPRLIEGLDDGGAVLVVWAALSPAVDAVLTAVGVTDRRALLSVGMPPGGAFGRAIVAGSAPLDAEQLSAELVDVVSDALRADERIRTVVLECGEMTAFAEELRGRIPAEVYDYRAYLAERIPELADGAGAR